MKIPLSDYDVPIQFPRKHVCYESIQYICYWWPQMSLTNMQAPIYCTLRNLTYGHQHLWIVQSTILHKSLLNCNQLNIVLLHLMELEFYFTSYLFLLLISIWHIFFWIHVTFQKSLVSHFYWHNTFWKQDGQTLRGFW